MRPSPRSSSHGFSLVELCVALTVTAIVLGSIAVSMHSEARGLSERAERNAVERSASEMVGRVESELEYAIGVTPRAFLMTDLPPDRTGGVTVDTTLGFPASGVLLLDPGTGAEERIAYERLRPSTNRFEDLARGAQCGNRDLHLKNSLVRWAGMAVPIEDQVNPFPGEYDGVSLAGGRTVFFRGDGTGFSFRTPTDPTGNGDYMQNGAVQWGATVEGQDTLDGWSALYYQPVRELREEEAGVDVDRDGDLEDVYDLGRIRMTSWNAFADADERTEVALCGPIVLQRRCDWGGDLDTDQFDDPLFLWEPDTGRLHVNLFLVAGEVGGRIAPRRIETTLYLRNGSWE